MQSAIKFAGFGGQGILLMGKVLASTAMKEGLNVSWVPSYGAEMRGGTAYCTVIISDKPIGSPVVESPKYLVAMNGPSLLKFAGSVKSGGLIFVNSSLISFESGRSDISEIRLPVVEIAKDLGTVKAANIVALGAFIAKSGLVSMVNLRKCVEEEFSKKPKLIPLNLNAVSAGEKALLDF